ncbi:Protein ECM18 [Nakaseomyces bracarensis]|uniref:Protein ECM18 n=1 Tax=Nakaseomyces bracarensis TaxID=273131 RepID=A0ABR4NWX5_9SACH
MFKTIAFRRSFGTIGLLRDAQKTNIEARVLSRILNPVADGVDDPTIKSGWKLWATHLFQSKDQTIHRLKMLQNKLMDTNNLTTGTKSNKMLFNEINQWHYQNLNATEVTTPTLLVHGYAATSTSFFRIFEYLTKSFRDVHAIDLPGNGLSFTPELDIGTTEPLPLEVQDVGKDGKYKVSYTIDENHHKYVIQKMEDYYIDRIEQWRLDNKLPSINVVGHSFGGYLSFKYAVKYPRSVNCLALVSPLGMERNLYSVNNGLYSNTIYQRDYDNCNSPHYDRRFKLNQFLFERQLRPLRWLGPLGAKLCWNYIRAAYQRVPSLEYKEYAFETFYGKGGLPPQTAQIFTKLFNNSLLAKDPILDSLHHLHTKKLLLMYGQYDWMNKNAGRIMASTVPAAQYAEIPDAGHNIFLDNPDHFSKTLTEFLS